MLENYGREGGFVEEGGNFKVWRELLWVRFLYWRELCGVILWRYIVSGWVESLGFGMRSVVFYCFGSIWL